MQDLSTRYALFTQLPLLQGISSTELIGWEDALRLDLDEFPASKLPLIRQGDNCTQLLYLVEGKLQREHRSADGNFAIRSYLRAPAVIEVDRLFGLNPTYEYTYWAKTEVRMLGIPKSFLGRHLMKSEVFRINLLNTLSAIAQKRSAALLPRQLGSVEERLKHFAGTLFPDCEGEVELSIKMTDLARYVGDSRLIVSRLLNRLNEEGSIRLGREHFTVHDIKTFLSTKHD
jgi:CRP-like cAMP-binding protein